MKKNKSEDYKISAVKYYLNNNKNQIQTCKNYFLNQYKFYLILDVFSLL